MGIEKELQSLRTFPHKDHEDNLDAEIIARSFFNLSMASGIPVKYLRPEYPKINPEDIHVDLPQETHLKEEKSTRQQLTDEIYRKDFFCEPVLDGPLPDFCRAHHCTERGPKCDRCGYTAFSSSHRRKLEG